MDHVKELVGIQKDTLVAIEARVSALERSAHNPTEACKVHKCDRVCPQCADERGELLEHNAVVVDLVRAVDEHYRMNTGCMCALCDLYSANRTEYCGMI